MHESWSKMLVLNGNMVTDTFFLLSGVLLAYTEIIKKEKSSNWKLDVIGLYLHRYTRLTPAYAMMIGFYATIYSKFGSGPHWDVWVGSNREYCRDNWWSNLLYVNNYVNVPDMCMSQSWYLATDMQLIWLSPIFLYPMLKPARRIFFWIVIGFAFVLSMLLPFAVTFIHRYTATMFYYKEQQDVANVFLYVYTRVYTRAGPYIVGLALGYLLAKRRSYDIKLRKPYIVSGWLIAIAVGLSAVLGAREMYFDKHPYNRLEASFYAGMHRQAFALAVSWIIFSSVYGYAGPVGEFLSWRGWTPLSRLTYSAYLCHYVFLLSRAGSVRTTGDLTSMSVDDRAKVFGSTDSKKEIYRTIEDSSSSTVAEIYKNVTNSENIRSICDSEETVDYYVVDEEERNKGTISSDGRREDDNCGDCIYVIDASELDDNRNSFGRSDLEEGRNRTERI
ncbi:O-acyltransferase like protein-like [Vespula squamosa]|uniref:O-acyltransferase like protein-like n=1 Tax=Vespula squamosa TaxID=30214 RepID=A0ABD2BFL9_VESSQ